MYRIIIHSEYIVFHRFSLWTEAFTCLPLSNIVKVWLCLNVKQFTDNSEIFVYSFCFLFIKDFSCGRVRSRNRVLPPKALTLGALNRLVISVISHCYCISSRSNFVVQAICSASKNLKNLLLSSRKPSLWYVVPGVASFLIFVAIWTSINGILFPHYPALPPA